MSILTDSEALLALYAGTEDEQAQAQEWFYDHYHSRLVATLVAHFCIDEECVQTGTALAFIEFFKNAEKETLQLYEESNQPWKWLLRRAISRTWDARRQARRLVTGVPTSEKEQLKQIDFEEHPDALSVDDDPVENMVAKESILQFIEELDLPDRGIFLHDLVMKYDLLTESEALEYNEELIGKSHALWTDDALRKRRQRIHQRLRSFLQRRLT